MADDINTTASALLECVCAALADIGRPTCACYQVIGAPMSLNCCECEPGVSGELTINLVRLFEADPNTLDAITRLRPCKRGTVAASFEITLTRCYPTITAGGDLPDPVDQDDRAQELNGDAATVWWALSCCPDRVLQIAEVTVEIDPTGGCSYLVARVSAEVSPRPPQVVS